MRRRPTVGVVHAILECLEGLDVLAASDAAELPEGCQRRALHEAGIARRAKLRAAILAEAGPVSPELRKPRKRSRNPAVSP